jgi:putative Holliday junction resolvase
MSVEGPILALDYGTVRIGMAVSDAEAQFAFPAGILTSQGRERDIAALREVIAERQIRRIVVGLPLHLDGRRGDAARAAEKFANAVAEGTGLPVEMLDERWTTQEALRALQAAGRNQKQLRGSVDAAAAALLLQTWLARAHAARPGVARE